MSRETISARGARNSTWFFVGVAAISTCSSPSPSTRATSLSVFAGTIIWSASAGWPPSTATLLSSTLRTASRKPSAAASVSCPSFSVNSTPASTGRLSSGAAANTTDWMHSRSVPAGMA